MTQVKVLEEGYKVPCELDVTHQATKGHTLFPVLIDAWGIQECPLALLGKDRL